MNLEILGSPLGIVPSTPHTGFVATQHSFSTNEKWQTVGTMTWQEILSAVPKNGQDYFNTAAVSVNGIFRGFSTNQDSPTDMPKFTTPLDSVKDNKKLINCKTYNPFTEENDISYLLKGTEYKDLKNISYDKGSLTLDYSKQTDQLGKLERLV